MRLLDYATDMLKRQMAADDEKQRTLRPDASV